LFCFVVHLIIFSWDRRCMTGLSFVFFSWHLCLVFVILFFSVENHRLPVIIGAFEQLHNRERERKKNFIAYRIVKSYLSRSKNNLFFVSKILNQHNQHVTNKRSNDVSSFLPIWLHWNKRKKRNESNGINHFQEPYVTLEMFVVSL
jgi:hypothetical protein